MRVHHIYIASSPERSRFAAALLGLLDAHPELYYRIVGELAESAAPDDEARTRVAMAAAHVVILLVGGAPGRNRQLTEELRLARDGFTRRIPVLAVLAPGGTASDARVVDADRIVPWDGEGIVAAIEECSALPPAYRPRQRRPVPGIGPAASLM